MTQAWLTPQECIISTHAPLRGATELQKSIDVAIQISTHAPLRGATSTSDSDVSPAASFLLTRLCEARPVPTGPSARSPTFLLTRLCEARPADAGLRFCSFSYFYSRASARRDGTLWVATYHEVLFLLTRLCEARLTVTSLNNAKNHTISTHAPLRGATNYCIMEGGTLERTFLLTRLCEARPEFDLAALNTMKHFYSRASARRDG